MHAASRQHRLASVLCIVLLAGVGQVRAGEISPPQVCFEPVGEGSGACVDPASGQILIAVTMSAVDPPVTGAQIFVEYDQQVLTFISAQPGGGTFSTELFESVSNGLISYLVGDSFTNPVGPTAGPATVAILTFATSGANCATTTDALCLLVDEHNPPSQFGGAGGEAIVPLPCNLGSFCSGSLTLDGAAPQYNCPFEDGEIVNAGGDCQAVTAHLEWDAITALDDCDGSPPAGCVATYFPPGALTPCTSDAACGAGRRCADDDLDPGTSRVCGVVRNDLTDGGDFPMGRAVVACHTADACDHEASCAFAVDNTGANTLVVDVEMSPTMSNGPVERCMEFEVTECGLTVGEPERVRSEVVLGFPLASPGHGAAVVNLPAGNWECLQARDVLHSLRATCDIECVNDFQVQDPDTGEFQTLSVWHASFKGSPSQSATCHWLIQGNLNGDAVVDIVDYAIWLSQAGTEPDANVSCDFMIPCTTNAECADHFTNLGITNLLNPRCVDRDPITQIGVCRGQHADINGDGVVNILDFTFILTSFLKSDKNGCDDVCPSTGASREEPTPRTSISVAELREMGLGRAAVEADINRDGVVDLKDVSMQLNHLGDASGERTTRQRRRAP